MAAPQAESIPLSPYSNGVLDEELMMARDFAESLVQNPAGLESSYYALWNRWLLILKAAVASRLPDQIPPPTPPTARLTLLNFPQHDIYVTRFLNYVSVTDEDVITPRPRGSTRTQIPDGNIQFVWRDRGNLQSRTLVNLEVKTFSGLVALDRLYQEADDHEDQVRLQAILSLGSNPDATNRVGALLVIGRYWRWTVLSPVPGTPLVDSRRNVRDWADTYGARMRHTGPNRGPANVPYWSDFVSLDDEESPEHAAAFEELVQTLTSFCRIRPG